MSTTIHDWLDVLGCTTRRCPTLAATSRASRVLYIVSTVVIDCRNDTRRPYRGYCRLWCWLRPPPSLTDRAVAASRLSRVARPNRRLRWLRRLGPRAEILDVTKCHTRRAMMYAMTSGCTFAKATMSGRPWISPVESTRTKGCAMSTALPPHPEEGVASVSRARSSADTISRARWLSALCRHRLLHRVRAVREGARLVAELEHRPPDVKAEDCQPGASPHPS